MSITSTEIREVGFEHSLRGYDIEQVDVFLERMADGVDELTAELESLRAKALEPVFEPVPEPQPEPSPVTPVASEPAFDIEELERADARAREAEAALSEAQVLLRAAEERARAAEDKVSELEQELEEKKSRDSIISDAFIAAQRSAEQLKEEARAEGERIYRESEAKARQFIRDALEKKQQIFTEIDTLEASCAKFRKDYQKMLEHFSSEAEGQFSELRPPVIPESVVNELMPKPAVQQAEEQETPEQASEQQPADVQQQPGTGAIPEDRIPVFDVDDSAIEPGEESSSEGAAGTALF